jgi:hypothetical protein
VLDIHYAAFMRDPMTTIRSIYDHMGADLVPEVEERMRGFLAAHPADKHGTHHYGFADTGLDPDAVRERSRRYREHFGVPDEPFR